MASSDSSGNDVEPPIPASQSSAFRARMKQFEYSPRREPDGLRRSTRKSGSRPSIPPQSPDASPDPRKRLRSGREGTEQDVGGVDEQDPGLATSERISAMQTPKKRKTTTKQRAARDPYHPVNNLVDSLRPDLILVCIGLNPGLMTASTGHAYAHPSNRFWHLLYESGVTEKKHIPAETRDLQDLYQIGNTNICARPTRSGDGLSKEEMSEGAVILEQKIAHYKPEAVVIVGKGIWETIWAVKKGVKKFKDPDFRWGWQDEDMHLGRTVDHGKVVWPGAKTFVATSTSGLAATLTPAQKLAIWKPLGHWMVAKRKEVSSDSTREHSALQLCQDI